MDTKDLEILKLLLFDGRLPYETIAKKVGFSTYIVKNKINNLIELGVIQKFVTNLNFMIFQKSVCYSLAEVKSGTNQEELIERIGKLKEVGGGAISLQNKMQIIHTYSTDYEFKENIKKLMKFDEIVDLENYILLIPTNMSFKSTRLTPNDWKIINSIKNNCRKSDVEIADELGISSKTVKRRLKYLIDNNIIFFMIDLDTSAADFLSYLLIVEFQKVAGKSLTQVMKIVKNVFYVWRVANQEAFIITVFVEKLREIEEHIRAIEKLDYIKDVISYVPTKMYYFESGLDDLIREKAQG